MTRDVAHIVSPATLWLMGLESQQILAGKDQLEPEKKLMAAILEDALWDFQQNVRGRNGREKKLSRKAEEWILTEESQQLYSFDSICLHLDINSECLRRRLMAWKSTALRDGRRVPDKELRPSHRLLFRTEGGSARRHRMK